jgi:hypothetical protein
VYSYYQLVPLVYCYCYVGYLSDSVDYSSSSQLECFTDVGVFPCILLADAEAFGFPSVKLHALHGSVVPAGVIVLLGFVIHNVEVVANQPTLGCYISMCGFLAVI